MPGLDGEVFFMLIECFVWKNLVILVVTRFGDPFIEIVAMWAH